MSDKQSDAMMHSLLETADFERSMVKIAGQDVDGYIAYLDGANAAGLTPKDAARELAAEMGALP